MAINNTVGAPVFPNTVGVGGLLDASEAAQYALNRTATTYPAYAAYPTGNDTNIASVSVLCHCDTPGSANNNLARVFCTIGSGGFAQMGQGSPTGTAGFGFTSGNPKWGGLTTYIQSSAGCFLLFTQQASELTFGTGDFTIEFWMRRHGSFSNLSILDPRTSASQVIPLIYYDTTPHIRYFVSGADKITGTTTVTVDVWHHIALSRVSGSTYMYLDGTQEGSTYTDGNNYISLASWYFSGQKIGGVFGAAAEGAYQDIRITKGVGRYSGSTLTVPTAPFPDY